MAKKGRSPLGMVLTLLVLGVVVWAGHFFYKGPEQTVDRIHVAMKQGDIPALRKHIDFPALRSNIKVRMAKEVSKATKADGTSFGIGMELISGVVLDKVIGQLITPEWLVGAGMATPSAEHQALEKNLAAERKTRIKDLNESHVIFTHERGSMTLIFERRGVSWVLVDVDGELNKLPEN